MNGKKASISSPKYNSLYNIKCAYLKYYLGHNPSSEEISEYVLSIKGKELDESKEIGKLNLSSYNLDCVHVKIVRVFVEGKDAPQAIRFTKSISVAQILSELDGNISTHSFILTEINSSIVLKDDITNSLDLTCIL